MSALCTCGHSQGSHLTRGPCTVARCQCQRFVPQADNDPASTSDDDTFTLPTSITPGSNDNAPGDNPAPVNSPDPDFSGGGGAGGGGGADSTF